jgi:preprotein translocase subunit SecG
MGFLTVFLSVVFVIVCLLLLIIVLLQDEQGNTVGAIFSGSSSSTFGTEAGNVLTRFTTILGLLFMGISLFLSVMNRSGFNDQAFLDSLKSEETVRESSFWGSSPEDGEVAPESESP